MEKDTINYYLLFNNDMEVLVFYDKNKDSTLLPQKEDKTMDMSYESKIAKITMLLKEKDSSNDVLVSKKGNKVFDRTEPFMNNIFETININDAELIDTYNGEYTVYEYSVGRFILELDYLLCNYYAKYIDLTEEQYLKIKSLCETYNFEVDFIKLDEILKDEEKAFKGSDRYIKKLKRQLNVEN